MAFRRKELEKFLVRLATHPYLHTSPDLQVFLTANEEQLNRAQNPASESGWGSSLGSLWSSVTKGVSEVASSYDEVEAAFNDHKAYASRMETAAARLADAGQSLVPRHLELEGSLEHLRKELQLVADVEKLPLPFDRSETARVFETLAQTLRMNSALEVALTEKIETGWEESLRDYVRLFDEMTRMLSHRGKVLGQWQSRVKTTSSKRDALAAATGSKADTIRKELEQADKAEAEAKLAFDTTNASVRNELIRFESSKQADLKASVKAFAHAQLEYHVQAADLFKQVLSSIDQ